MKLQFKDTYAYFNEGKLLLGNSRLNRAFDLTANRMFTTTLEISTVSGKTIRAANRAPVEDFTFFDNNCAPEELAWSLEAVYGRIESHPRFGAPYLVVNCVIHEALQQLTLRREFRIWPGAPFLAIRNHIRSSLAPNIPWTNRRELIDEFAATCGGGGRVFESRMDVLAPSADFRPRLMVEFFGRTDFCDTPVVIREFSGEGRFRGNICSFSNPDGYGFFYLQEAPPYMERRDLEQYDFRYENGVLASCGWGISPVEIEPGHEYASYFNMLCVYRPGEQPESLLKEYLRLRFPLPHAACRVTVNPWGGGRFGERINPQFLLDEVEAAADCGAESYQIDDGWQAGGTLAELCSRNRKIDAWEFWRYSERLPDRSLQQLRAVAERHGIELSLWIAPSSNDDYRDWCELRDILLGFYTRDGISCFKLDGTNLRTSRAEENFSAMLEGVETESGNAVVFNFDLTWGQRQGYFRCLEYGTLFLENRYVCYDSGLGYHPERSWRNVWRLAHWHEMQRFQIEIPHPGEINREFYRAKSESQPDSYSLEYWCALTLFANPLLWFMPSRIPKADRAVVRRMMEFHRRHRAAIFSGVISPVGSEPDGASLSGLISAGGSDGVWLLLLREHGESSGRFRLSAAPGTGDFELLLGEGECVGSADDGFREFHLPATGSFAVFHGVAIEKER